MPNILQNICQNPLLKEEFNWKYLRTLGGHLNIAAIVSTYNIDHLQHRRYQHINTATVTIIDTIYQICFQILNFGLIHTSGKSFCHLIWPHLVNWTLTFAVIGIFTSFIFLLSYLVKAVSDYMDRFVFRATCRPTCQVNYRYSSFDFKLRCCLINRYKNIQSKPYKYQNLNFR